MIAFDVNAEKLGLSGAQSTLVTVSGDGSISDPSFGMALFEFDCFANQLRTKKTSAYLHGQLVDALSTSPSTWTPAPPGSQLQTMLDVACKGRSAIPETWIENGPDLGRLAAFYYVKVLGQTPPSH